MFVFRLPFVDFERCQAIKISEIFREKEMVFAKLPRAIIIEILYLLRAMLVDVGTLGLRA